MNILVSACLLGVKCKYSGGDNLNEAVLRLGEKHSLIPVCPEVLGGLSTPRPPAEIQGERVVNRLGEDVTEQYLSGAQRALALAKERGCTCAVLKERSPSCGKGEIYDGTFTSTLIDGMGITAKLLEENGIKVYGESQLHMILEDKP